MALKDLLVYVDQTDDALTRLRLAADLAACHGARLTALFVRECIGIAARQQNSGWCLLKR
jgi:hypothetical protein